jgi:hypothetical protein
MAGYRSSVTCRSEERHTPAPAGYVEWFEWVAEMATTHRQERCPGCGLFVIWTPLRRAAQPSTQEV